MSKKENYPAHYPQERPPLEALLHYISFLLRYKYFIFGVTSFFAVSVVVFSLISIRLPPEKSYMPNYFESNAVLIINQDTVSGFDSILTTLGVSPDMAAEGLNYGDLAMNVLHSRPFLDNIVNRLNIAEKYNIDENVRTKSRRLLIQNSNIEFDMRTGTLQISYQDIDPVFARDVVQTMVDNLQEWFQRWEGTSTQQELSTVRDKINEVSVEIQRLEEEIKAFQKEYGVLSIDQLAEAQAERLSDLRSQLIQTEVEIKNYAGFSNIEDQAIIQLQAQRDSLQELIRQIEEGAGSGSHKLPSLEELPELAIDFTHLQMSHQLQMRIYQNLMEQYEVQKLSVTASSVFNVLEPPEIPEEKTGPMRGELCIKVTLVGFIASILLAIFIELIKNIKNDPRKKKILKGEEV